MPDVLLGLAPQSPTDDQFILFYVPVPQMDTPNFETFQRDAQYTWVPQERLSRDPAMQFTGPGEETITIEGRMYPHHFGGLSTLERLRVAGRAGKPLVMVRFFTLTNPRGLAAETIGHYVIRRVRTSESKISSIGIASKIDFTVELTRYGDDLDGNVGNANDVITSTTPGGSISNNPGVDT